LKVKIASGYKDELQYNFPSATEAPGSHNKVTTVSLISPPLSFSVLIDPEEEMPTALIDPVDCTARVQYV